LHQKGIRRPGPLEELTDFRAGFKDLLLREGKWRRGWEGKEGQEKEGEGGEGSFVRPRF